MAANLAKRTVVMSGKHLVAVCQLTCRNNINENLNICQQLIADAARANAKMIFLPECFDYIGENREESIRLACDERSHLIDNYRSLAIKHSVWLSLGGFHERNPNNTLRPFNTHLVIDNRGDTVGKYRKLHLFDVDISDKVRVFESEFTTAGSRLVTPIDTPIGRLGLNTCYDLRFAEMGIWNRMENADILTYPSAFTSETGRAHWEVLLRARAIENQCYVIAAAQVGVHNTKRTSHGHAMIVDPWGTIAAECSDNESICYAQIDLDHVTAVRRKQPVYKHRRDDIYSINFATNQSSIHSDETLMFGAHPIVPDVIFYRSRYSFAFVNRKPVLKGHVLVAPIRCAQRMTELSDCEIADLFTTVKRLEFILDRVYGVSSTTISLQDGPDAGQTVPHVHVHVLPRHADDFDGDNDRIYTELATHDKCTDDGQFRTIADMSDEASVYRRLLDDNDSYRSS